MTLDEILRPCICGLRIERYRVENGAVQIYCAYCKKQTRFHRTAKQARKEWNKNIAQEQCNDYNESTLNT